MNSIRLRKGKTIQYYRSDVNVVTLFEDKSCDMKCVVLNDNHIMEGNSEDFYNGCHGHYSIPEFSSAIGLASLIKEIIVKSGYGCKIEYKDYKYEY